MRRCLAGKKELKLGAWEGGGSRALPGAGGDHKCKGPEVVSYPVFEQQQGVECG